MTLVLNEATCSGCGTPTRLGCRCGGGKSPTTNCERELKELRNGLNEVYAEVAGLPERKADPPVTNRRKPTPLIPPDPFDKDQVVHVNESADVDDDDDYGWWQEEFGEDIEAGMVQNKNRTPLVPPDLDF